MKVENAKTVEDLIALFAITQDDIDKIERLVDMGCPDELIKPIIHNGLDLKLMAAGKAQLVAELQTTKGDKQ